ncbi:unnamed protein product [Prorocentrum cordatum]|uniref:Uncharacterized protein n=1 Tax=Prorocentrum cordatum TaxID=2364126 RepID=A0ABN9W6P9_9DINO|nr:unnamed protein product [Polarella glacialis]
MRTHPERFTQEPHGAGRERSEERGREHGRLGESALLVMRSTSVITAKPKVRQPHTGRGARNISAEPQHGPIIRREACRACALYTRSTRRKKTIDECGTTPPLLGRCARREARRANERHIESGLTREEIAALRRGLCGPHRYCPIHPRASDTGFCKSRPTAKRNRQRPTSSVRTWAWGGGGGSRRQRSKRERDEVEEGEAEKDEAEEDSDIQRPGPGALPESGGGGPAAAGRPPTGTAERCTVLWSCPTCSCARPPSRVRAQPHTGRQRAGELVGRERVPSRSTGEGTPEATKSLPKATLRCTGLAGVLQQSSAWISAHAEPRRGERRTE